MTANFRLEARKPDGTYLATLPARNIQGEWWWNKVKQLRFELPLYHNVVTRANVDPGKTEVQLYRNNVKIFTGPLWDVTASSGDAKLSCSCESIESYLDLRRIDTDLRYVSQAGDQVMWDLINRAQTGTDAALYITQGTLQAAPAQTATYLRSDAGFYGDAVSKLADDTSLGFDWEIDADRKLQIYYPRPQVASRSKLVYGQSVTAYSVQVQGKWEANDIVYRGDTGVRSDPVIDTAKRAEYGLRQLADNDNKVKLVATATQRAQRLLSLHRDVRETPSITLRAEINPFEGDIWMGQTADVIINDYWAQYNQTMRLDGFQLSVGKQGSETVVLYMTDLREVS